MNPGLGPGHFDAIKNCFSGLLHFRCGAQVKHHPLYIRLMRNIRGAEFQCNRITNLFGNVHSLGAISGDPGRESVYAIGIEDRLDLMSIKRTRTVFDCRT